MMKIAGFTAETSYSAIMTGLYYLSIPLLYAALGEDMTALTGSLSILSIFIIHFFTSPSRFSFCLRLPDLILAGYLFYCLINTLLQRQEFLPFTWWFRWMAFIFCYLIVRFLSQPSKLLPYILTGGLIQSILVILQAYHWLESNHTHFPVTGSFGNPAQAGGYIAFSLIAGVCMSLSGHQKRFSGPFRFIILIILLYALILSDSRASWLAVFTGIWYSLSVSGINLSRSLFRSAPAKILLLIVCISLGFCIYLYKKDSANGRLLIWRVSTQMLANAPFTGHGAGSFRTDYIYQQSEYFSHHPDSPAQLLAGHPAYPYNEFLHIAVEEGIIGALLFLGILISLWRVPDNFTQLSYKSLLLTLLIYSLFSYPADVFPLFIGYAICAGAIRGKPVTDFTLSPFVKKYLLFTPLLFIFFFNTKAIITYQQIKNKIPFLLSDHELSKRTAINFLIPRYLTFRNIPYFMDIYAQWAFKNHNPQQNILILERAARTIPSVELYTDLGKLYQRAGKPEAAENCFIKSVYMIPHRLYPLCCLMEFYKSTGQPEKAVCIAKEIISRTVKNESTETLLMKDKARKFLNVYNKNKQ